MKGQLLANVSKKEMQRDICYNIEYFVHICNISNIACKTKSQLISWAETKTVLCTDKKTVNGNTFYSFRKS